MEHVYVPKSIKMETLCSPSKDRWPRLETPFISEGKLCATNGRSGLMMDLPEDAPESGILELLEIKKARTGSGVTVVSPNPIPAPNLGRVVPKDYKERLRIKLDRKLLETLLHAMGKETRTIDVYIPEIRTQALVLEGLHEASGGGKQLLAVIQPMST